MTANRLTSFLLMVIVFSPITDIFSDALWDDNITDAQHGFVRSELLKGILAEHVPKISFSVTESRWLKKPHSKRHRVQEYSVYSAQGPCWLLKPIYWVLVTERVINGAKCLKAIGIC